MTVIDTHLGEEPAIGDPEDPDVLGDLQQPVERGGRFSFCRPLRGTVPSAEFPFPTVAGTELTGTAVASPVGMVGVSSGSAELRTGCSVVGGELSGCWGSMFAA